MENPNREEDMSAKLARQFELKVDETIEIMLRQKLDILEIPESGGMVIVRKGSDQHKDRDIVSGRQIKALEKGQDTFIVCHN